MFKPSQTWQDTIANKAREPLLKIQRFAHTAHMAGGVFDSDQQGPSGRVGEGYQSSTFRRRSTLLEAFFEQRSFVFSSPPFDPTEVWREKPKRCSA